MVTWKVTGGRPATVARDEWRKCSHCNGSGRHSYAVDAADEVTGRVSEDDYSIYRHYTHGSEWFEEDKEYDVKIYTDKLQECLLAIAMGTNAKET